MAQPTAPGQAALASLWWAVAISGAAAILFGLAAIIWPGLTLFVLVALFGIYAIIEGIAALIAMFRALRLNATWWPYLLLAVLSLGAGILVLLYPGITSVLLLYSIAFWAIAIGLVEAITSIFSGQWLRVLSGVISVVFGFILLSNPLAGALALVMVIGVFAIVRGILLIVQAIQAPSVARQPQP